MRAKLNLLDDGVGQYLCIGKHQKEMRMRVRVEGEAGGKDDAAELPSVPVERGAAVVERDRIHPGQPLAAVGAAEWNRIVVINQFAPPPRSIVESRKRYRSISICDVPMPDGTTSPRLMSRIRRHTTTLSKFGSFTD